MTAAISWLTPDITETLGWTLLHFLWQGAALALLLYVVSAFCRGSLTRYNASVLTLLLMALCPVATYFVLRRGPEPAVPAWKLKDALEAVQGIATSPVPLPISNMASLGSAPWMTWFVLAWLAGVMIFGLRALGGWILLERLWRERAEPVTAALGERCLAIQGRLGLARTIRYLQSQLVESPSVAGWFRPVVLLPATALTGLSPEQLEAVIAHELAHIKRLDCFVNLFQIVAETVLFYHPAVWWVSRCVRNERENCCDDIAVATCGNVNDYARALTLMETWRKAPDFLIAANSGSLKSRISRLLGIRTISTIPRAGLAAIAVLCAAGALVASSAFQITFSHPAAADFIQPQAPEQSAPPLPPSPPEAPPPAAAAPAAPQVPSVPPPPRAAVNQEERKQDQPPLPPAAPEPPAPPAAPGSESKGSYIDELRSAGLTNLSVDDLITLKIQGITADYVRDMRAAGLDTRVHRLVSMKVQGITPEYVRQMRGGSQHERARSDYLPHDGRDSGLRRSHAVRRNRQSDGPRVDIGQGSGHTPEFVQKVHSHSMHQLISLKMANVF
jgi:beta-lactamase regulating signal transducer with metallopeptidase domain